MSPRLIYVVANVVLIFFLYWQITFIIFPEVGHAYPFYEPGERSTFISLIGVVLALSPSLMIRLKSEVLSEVILGILYPMLYIPSVFYLFYVGRINAPVKVLVGLTMAAIFIGLIILNSRLPMLKLANPKPSINPGILIFASLVLFVAILIKLGLPQGWVDIADVYSQRDIYKETLDDSSGIWSYVMIWTSYVIVPFLLSYSLVKKNFLVGCLACLMQLTIYLHSGLKSVAFSLLIIVGTYFALKFVKRIAYTWTLAICGLFAVSNLLYYTFHFKFPALHFVRRMFITPGVHFSLFVEFFEEHRYYIFSHSILSSFVLDRYDLSPPHEIAKAYYPSEETSANANIFGDAYANLGIPGMFAIALLFLVVLRVLDTVTKGVPLAFLLPSSFSLIYALSNSAMLTILLSYGLFLYIVLVYLTRPALQRL